MMRMQSAHLFGEVAFAYTNDRDAPNGSVFDKVSGDPELLQGVAVVEGNAIARQEEDWGASSTVSSRGSLPYRCL